MNVVDAVPDLHAGAMGRQTLAAQERRCGMPVRKKVQGTVQDGV